MKKLASFIVLAFMLVFCAVPAYANGIPNLPHAFYGSVKINGSPAPVGTTVEARGEGVATGVAGNPVTTTTSGIYGTASPFEPRLVVQGDINEGTTITFYVNDVSTGKTAEWHSGETTQLNLSVTISAPVSAPPSGGGEPPPTIRTTLFGTSKTIKIDSKGIIQETIEATSADGELTITIPKGTKALDKDGKPLSSLKIDVDPSPPDPPEDASIIGLAYDFGPAGATFEPPITLEYTYDPDTLPEGVAEEDLVIAYYDKEAGKWVELECVVDTENNTITALVSHFTCFAIIARVTPAPTPPPPAAVPAAFAVSNLTIQPAKIQPRETVSITVSVANTGGTEGSYTVVLKLNGVKEAEKSVTIAAGSSEIVTFSVTREEAGSYSVDVNGLTASFTVEVPAPPPPPEKEKVTEVPAKPVPWPLIGGIIAAVVVVASLVYFLVVRRRAY